MLDPVRAKTVRMDELLWVAVEREAATSGCSEAELLRRAATLYLAVVAAANQAPDGITPADVLAALRS